MQDDGKQARLAYLKAHNKSTARDDYIPAGGAASAPLRPVPLYSKAEFDALRRKLFGVIAKIERREVITIEELNTAKTLIDVMNEVVSAAAYSVERSTKIMREQARRINALEAAHALTMFGRIKKFFFGVSNQVSADV